MPRIKRSPKALDAMFDKYLSMRMKGKPSQEINIALNLPGKYAQKFVERIISEGKLEALRKKPEYQIAFGKMSLCEISRQMYGESSQFSGKEQVWKVEKSGDSLILTPYSIVSMNHEAEATHCNSISETDIAVSDEISGQSN